MGIDLIRAVPAKGAKGLPVPVEANALPHAAFAAVLQSQEERLPSLAPNATDEATKDPVTEGTPISALPIPLSATDASAATEAVRSQAASSPPTLDPTPAPSAFAAQTAPPLATQQATGSAMPDDHAAAADFQASDSTPPSVRQTGRPIRVDTGTGSAESRQMTDPALHRRPAAAPTASGRQPDRLASVIAAAFPSDPAPATQDSLPHEAAASKGARGAPATDVTRLAGDRLAAARSAADKPVNTATPERPAPGPVSAATAEAIRPAQPQSDRDRSSNALPIVTEVVESQSPRPEPIGPLEDGGRRLPQVETPTMTHESGSSLPAATAEGRSLRPNPPSAPALARTGPTDTDAPRWPGLPATSTEAQSASLSTETQPASPSTQTQLASPSTRLTLADAAGVEAHPGSNPAVGIALDPGPGGRSMPVASTTGDPGLPTQTRAVAANLPADPGSTPTGPGTPQTAAGAQEHPRRDAELRLNASGTPPAFESVALLAGSGATVTARASATPRLTQRALPTMTSSLGGSGGMSGLSGLSAPPPDTTSPAGIAGPLNEAPGPRRPGTSSDAMPSRLAVSATMGFAVPMPANLPLQDREPTQANPIPITVPVQDPRFPDAFSGRVSWLVREGIQVAELSLHPQELGPIRIEISMDGGAAQLNLSVAHAQTRGAIEQSMDRLRDMLSEQGLQLGSTLFDTGASARKDSERERTGKAERRQSGSEASRNVEASPLTAAPERPRTVPSGRIDLFA